MFPAHCIMSAEDMDVVDGDDFGDFGVFTRTANRLSEPVHVPPRIDADKYQTDIPPMLILPTAAPVHPVQSSKKGSAAAAAAAAANSVAVAAIANSKGMKFEYFFTGPFFSLVYSHSCICI